MLSLSQRTCSDYSLARARLSLSVTEGTRVEDACDYLSLIALCVDIAAVRAPASSDVDVSYLIPESVDRVPRLENALDAPLNNQDLVTKRRAGVLGHVDVYRNKRVDLRRTVPLEDVHFHSFVSMIGTKSPPSGAGCRLFPSSVGIYRRGLYRGKNGDFVGLVRSSFHRIADYAFAKSKNALGLHCSPSAPFTLRAPRVLA